MTQQGESQNRLSIEIHQVLKGPPHEGEAGEGLTFQTNLGNLRGILHPADSGSQMGVIWVCGARGGFGGPASGLYAELSESFRARGITSLRLDYRLPNALPECALDLLVGVEYLRACGYRPAVVVGHSFGGAVVIAAGAASEHVGGVVSLSPQTFGANMAGMLSPTPLLIVHGKADTRLPYSCALQIYQWAKEPKQLVLYEGAEHRLDECREELCALLSEWVPQALGVPSN